MAASAITLPPQALALDPNLARYLSQDQVLPACQALMATLSKPLATTASYATGDDIPRRLHSQLTDICNAFFGSEGADRSTLLSGWLHRSLSKAEENAIRALFNPSGPLIRQLFRGCNRDDLLFQVAIDKLPARWKTMLQEGKHLELPNAIRIRMETGKLARRPGMAMASSAALHASIGINKASLLGAHGTATSGSAPITEQTTVKLYMLEYWMFCFIRSLTTGTSGGVLGGGYLGTGDTASRASSKGVSTLYQELAIDLLHYFLPLPDQLSGKASGVFESRQVWPAKTDHHGRTLDSYVDQAVRMDTTLFLFTVAAECWLPSAYRYSINSSSSKTSTSLIISVWLIYLTPWHMFVEKDSKDQAILQPQQLEKDWRMFILDNLLFYTRLVQLFLQRAAQFDVTGRQERTSSGSAWSNGNVYGGNTAVATGSAYRPLNWRAQCRLVERVMEKLDTPGLLDILKDGEIIMLNRDGDMTGPAMDALRRHPAAVGGGSTAVATLLAAHRPDTSDVVLRARWQQLSSDKYDCLYLTVKPHATIMRALAHFRLAEKSCQEKLKELDPMALLPAGERSSEEMAAAAALNESHLSESFIQKAISTVKRWRQGDQHEKKVQQLQRYIRVIGGVADRIQTTFRISEEASRQLGLYAANHGTDYAGLWAEVMPTDSNLLSPSGRRMVRQGWRKCSPAGIKPRGPRAQTYVMSYENAWLVEWTLLAEQWLNEELVNLVDERTIIQIPTIRLRWLASYINLAHVLLWCWLTAYWPRFGLFLLALVLLGWLVVYGMEKLNQLTRGNSDRQGQSITL
ncbi:hypothetical protein SYNPS1DRAFT_21221 [Syncephalis pseudoplumigaleata]|uniref:Sphingomyelin phosphodiesterase 4 n=1 Tax=Syncephalis pseudoplumigaleata TaxID=1712513 RepID=A0A4P9Z3P9_9FUNG|nr:hypothetical protein SYNPS1DRAFT_21221 [Syncephalis pseudoplumigaleata]|eukprot:RKP27187.1 hypothetical protein SYNPS1DRAFT_21221 [Syncephalis pseudoplumigaleata]